MQVNDLHDCHGTQKEYQDLGCFSDMMKQYALKIPFDKMTIMKLHDRFVTYRQQCPADGRSEECRHCLVKLERTLKNNGKISDDKTNNDPDHHGRRDIDDGKVTRLHVRYG
jgi:hypothetical protein